MNEFMYTFDSRVRYSEIDAEGKMTLLSILNYFQDCSTFHSEDLGVGIDYLKEIGFGWVLSYWQINILRYPALCEKITIGTFPYEFKGFLGSRNFIMRDAKGENIAYANSVWSFLDLRTGHPGRVPEKIEKAYILEERLSMNYEPRKIQVPKEFTEKEMFQVKPYHIDSNHHVNNGKYVQMALQYISENTAIKQMRAEYKKAAYLGNEIFPRVSQTERGMTVSLDNQEHQPYAIVEFQ